MESIKLVSHTVKGNRVEYKFSCPSAFDKYLKTQTFYMEYPEKYDLNQVPDALLMVPFVGNILTMNMFFGYQVDVPELDKTFYDSLRNIAKVYKEMFPYLHLKFDVKAKSKDCTGLIENKSLFFTGGLDATSALTEVAKQGITLINIWGGDVSTKDYNAHKKLDEYMNELSTSLSLKYAFVKSNCREMYDEKAISRFTALRIKPWENHGWWASFAHILAMTSLIAPLTYLEHIGIHYVASSYNANCKTFDANNELLINAIKFSSCKLQMVDNTLGRIEKAQKIILFRNRTNIPLKLKVCWFHKNGENCSQCEKCYRTILEIIVNHGNPNMFGFTFEKDNYLHLKRYLDNNFVNVAFWKPIQEKFNQERSYWEQFPEIEWFLNYKFNGIYAYMHKISSVLKKFIP